MTPKGILAKIGGSISILSLLLLPLARGCGQTITGVDVLKEQSMGAIKFYLIVSILCAVISLFFVKLYALLPCGILGLGALLINYNNARRLLPIEVEIGGYLALLGFVLIIISGFIPTDKPKNEDINNIEPPAPPPEIT